MLNRKNPLFQSPEGSEGSAGGGDDVQARIDKAVAEAGTGLKAKNSELIGTLKEQREKLSQFDGIDPTVVRNIIKRFADDEEAKLIADGKIDDVLNRRTDRMKADFEKRLGDAKQLAEVAERRAKAFQGRVLDDAIRAAAAQAGLHQHAIDDALFRARSMFTLDESGSAVMLGDDNKPVLGKDGKTAFGPGEWLDSMKEKAPHWFPAAASGGGATNSAGNNGNAIRGNLGGKPAERVAALRARFPELASK